MNPLVESGPTARTGGGFWGDLTAGGILSSVLESGILSNNASGTITPQVQPAPNIPAPTGTVATDFMSGFTTDKLVKVGVGVAVVGVVGLVIYKIAKRVL
jgi:hypothetical protein